jgi:hypothetical protein
MLRVVILSLWILMLSACDSSSENTTSSSVVEDKYTQTATLAEAREQADLVADVPELSAYFDKVQQSLTAKPPVLRLSEYLQDEKAKLAEELALASPEFTQFVYRPKTREPLRNEIMNIRLALPEDFVGDMGKCKDITCYRVEMYSFFYNNSTTAFVDVDAKKVIGISRHGNAQPDLSPHLVELAKKIANTSPEVIKTLEEAGVKAKLPDPVMAPIKTALNNTRCERSHHLCVAPTYLLEDKALWAIVDLTDGRLVGTRWTELGSSGPPIIVSERSLENEYVFNNYCKNDNHLQRDAWSMDYVITGSDGLQITDVRYNGKQVIKNAKLLDWHVNYSTRENFGYSDAIGCPMFSSAVVIAYNAPQVEPIKDGDKEIGFALIQDFRQPPWPTPCNYRYVQRYEFYHDGRFRVAAADYGRGCGTDGTYRPVIRIDVNADGENQVETLAEWKSGKWDTIKTEQWRLQDEVEFSPEGYQYRIQSEQGSGFYIEPGKGQFGDGGRGDHAYTYVTAYHADKDEGEQGMVTLGSCCNTDYRQGPEEFMNPPEPLDDKNLVFWYVPQLKNDGEAGKEYCWADTRVEKGVPVVKVWPCYAGPMFIPLDHTGN